MAASTLAAALASADPDVGGWVGVGVGVVVRVGLALGWFGTGVCRRFGVGAGVAEWLGAGEWLAPVRGAVGAGRHRAAACPAVGQEVGSAAVAVIGLAGPLPCPSRKPAASMTASAAAQPVRKMRGREARLRGSARCDGTCTL